MHPEVFARLNLVLERLSPPDLPLRAGTPVLARAGETRRHPTLHVLGRYLVPADWPFPVRRLASLAYAVTWAFARTQALVERDPGIAPAEDLILLVDGPEVHLHPRAVAGLAPALAELGTAARGAPSRTQVVLTTDSAALVHGAASIADERDVWFDLELQPGALRDSVVARRRPLAESVGWEPC